MKYTSKQLKSMARTDLSGKYGVYICAFVVYQLLNSLAAMALELISGQFVQLNILNAPNIKISDAMSISPSSLVIYFLLSLIIGLILSVLSLGFNKIFLDGSRGYPVKVKNLFFGFRHHPDRIILVEILLILIELACFLPAILMMTAGLILNLSLIFVILSFLLLIAGIVIMIILSIAFSQTLFLLADYDDLGPVQALKESAKLMRGHKGRYFYLQLSFIGLFLLGIASLYIGLLWILPYYNMTMTHFYRNVTNEI